MYDAHIQRIYRFFYYRVLDKQAAEDLSSQTFIRLAEKGSEQPPVIEDPVKYLYGVARHVFNDHLREKYRKSEFTLEDINDMPAAVEDEVDQLDQLDMQQRAQLFINLLPDAQREVAHRRLILQETPAEIADQLGRDKNYVKVTLRRALRKLEELVETRAVGTTEAIDE